MQNTTLLAAPPAASESQTAARRAATNALSAIIFREVLEPLAADLGPVGDVAIGNVADALFARPTT